MATAASKFSKRPRTVSSQGDLEPKWLRRSDRSDPSSPLLLLLLLLSVFQALCWSFVRVVCPHFSSYDDNAKHKFKSLQVWSQSQSRSLLTRPFQLLGPRRLAKLVGILELLPHPIACVFTAELALLVRRRAEVVEEAVLRGQHTSIIAIACDIAVDLASSCIATDCAVVSLAPAADRRQRLAHGSLDLLHMRILRNRAVGIQSRSCC